MKQTEQGGQRTETAGDGVGESSDGAGLSEQDRRVLDDVERYLSRGRELQRWWLASHGDLAADAGSERRPFEDSFELAFTSNRPDTSFGFFDTARVDGRDVPVLGNYQRQFYDRPKSGVERASDAARHIDGQLREFVLRYFLRVADFRAPQPHATGQPQPPWYLSPVSLCFRDDAPRRGFGYEQLYYKRRDDGRVGKFPAGERSAVVDLRQIGRRYEWLVLRVNIFGFAFGYAPFGDASPNLRLPLAESSLLVVSPTFVHDEGDGSDGRLGHYGLGYAFLRNPRPSLLAWGPGKFDAGFQSIDFEVLGDGRIRVHMVFVANRPTAVANVPMDPLLAGAEALDLLSGGRAGRLTEPVRRLLGGLPGSRMRFDPVLPAMALANLATGGLAGRALCLDREQLERQLILVHFHQHYNAIQGSLQTWRQIGDWLDEASLPRWVVTGRSA